MFVSEGVSWVNFFSLKFSVSQSFQSSHLTVNLGKGHKHSVHEGIPKFGQGLLNDYSVLVITKLGFIVHTEKLRLSFFFYVIIETIFIYVSTIDLEECPTEKAGE